MSKAHNHRMSILFSFVDVKPFFYFLKFFARGKRFTMQDQPFSRRDEGQCDRCFMPGSKPRFRSNLGERAKVVRSQPLRAEKVLRQPLKFKVCVKGKLKTMTLEQMKKIKTNFEWKFIDFFDPDFEVVYRYSKGAELKDIQN